nr:peptidase inhibitor family I36 protein [Streptomyces sp. SID13031]
MAATGVALAAATVPLSAGAASTAPTGPLAAEMAQLLKLQPGGIQVSDNALAWEKTGTVVVWPSPGESVAPAGLGNNVRADAARRAGVAAESSRSIQAVHGCPSGITVKDYYCFYTDSNWGGRRLQFTGATVRGNAGNWGFDNQTSSWVNTDTDVTVYAYDSPDSHLWTEPEKSVNSLVSSGSNDRMSQWQTQ